MSVRTPSKSSDQAAPVRIAFICTANACRSQMAEGLACSIAGPGIQIESAGSHPAGYIHPLAIEAMGEIGIDISRRKSKWIDDLTQPIDVVVTVCDHARDSCPQLRGRMATHHWSIPDPVAIQDNPLKARVLARKVRGELTTRIDELLRGLPAHSAPSPGRPRRMRRGRWIPRITVVATSLLVTLLGAELGFRLLKPQPIGFYAFDDLNQPDGSLRPRASGILCGVPVTINADAERGPAFSREKPPASQRVCVIGNSIVFGLGVSDDDRYPVATQRILRSRHPNKTIEIIPFSQIAGRLSGYRTRLLPKALAYRPDTVVLGFALNDFEPPPVGRAGPPITAIAPSGQKGVLATAKSITGNLLNHSHLVYWARKQAQILSPTGLMDHDDLIKAWELESMYPDKPDFKATWDYTVQQLDEIHDQCAAAGAQLIILVTPFDNQLSPDRLAFYRQTLPDLPDSCLHNIPQQRLAAYCSSRSLPFVDVTPAFKAHADKVFMRMLEGRIDLCHPTSEGHRLIAEALARKMEELSQPRR